jgi:CheY-like chemotaxis protein
VLGDPTRLRQILMNLAGNAVKFTETGSVAIHGRLEHDDGTTSVLRFDIVDTGIGIPDEVRDKLFGAFVQGDGSMARRYGGTGLGLAISRRLVELMNGTIAVEPNPAGGTIFTFDVQFGHVRQGPNAQTSTELKGLRALIVDDNVVARLTLTGYLTSWGILTADTDNPEHALAMAQDAVASGRPFDFIAIDYVMPQRDGISLGQEFASSDRYGRPALLLITAFDSDGRRDAALAVGFSNYLIKPVEPSALYNAIASIAAGGAATPIEPVSLHPEQRGAIRILLAEDQAVNRRVALLQLQELGYHADAVVNGAEAVAAAEAERYDVILMDMQMPGLDGLSAARAIRAQERISGNHASIIALTAAALDRDRQACLNAGMDDYLAKPLEIDALREVLERWLLPAVRS